jgi:hypothetical protein
MGVEPIRSRLQGARCLGQSALWGWLRELNPRPFTYEAKDLP